MSKSILLFLVVISLGACRNQDDPTEQYPTVPEISLSVTEIRENALVDSVYIEIEYLDGDGDIGLKSNEVLPPGTDDSTFSKNLFIEYYELRDSVFVKVPTSEFAEDTLRYYFRIPFLTPTSKNKAIKGTIGSSIALPTEPENRRKVIKYTVQIVDRALNKSNIVETAPFEYLVPKRE